MAITLQDLKNKLKNIEESLDEEITLEDIKLEDLSNIDITLYYPDSDFPPMAIIEVK